MQIHRDSPDGYNIGINIGAAAGQTGPHAQLHVIPRYAGDVEDPRGGIRQSSYCPRNSVVLSFVIRVRHPV
jgi:diadenosine tetraphosphate (Ap4A) HIT family hydrolase